MCISAVILEVPSPNGAVNVFIRQPAAIWFYVSLQKEDSNKC